MVRPARKDREIQRGTQIRDLGEMIFQRAPVKGVVARAVVVGEERLPVRGEQLRQNLAPLADRLRPRSLDDFQGQEEILGPGRLLRRAIHADRVGNLILYGPPGVGKTSVCKSIARAMNRNFVRLSLGGIRDEAEIRGHRRTYIGALPGRIIQNLKKVGANNPVILLDEIDKLGNDFRGDPASALLEVLDPEQNSTFTVHYLDIEFDLSKVMFIATANMLDTIPGPLRDRMEVVELSSYTENEKLAIARKYLLKKQLTEHALTEENLEMDDEALLAVIRSYTREAGVRNLERQLAAICRGVAANLARGWSDKTVVTADNLYDFLGVVNYTSEMKARTWGPGLSTGLAWTPVGGQILFIETSKMKGKGSLALTGKLGDVMKESASAALTYIRSNADALGVDEDIFSQIDLHVHVPDGATPKDGPSAVWQWLAP